MSRPITVRLPHVSGVEYLITNSEVRHASERIWRRGDPWYGNQNGRRGPLLVSPRGSRIEYIPHTATGCPIKLPDLASKPCAVCVWVCAQTHAVYQERVRVFEIPVIWESDTRVPSLSLGVSVIAKQSGSGSLESSLRISRSIP